MVETESNRKAKSSEEEQRLKYLKFVQVAGFHAATYSAKLYDYAKEKSGPLKPGVDTVETAVGPVYHKYEGVPAHVLKFLDRKVDESVSKVESRVPPTVKKVSTQAFETAKKASVKAKTMYAKYEPAAKDMYSKYEPMVEQNAATAWRAVNQLTVAVGSAARSCSDKYDRLVQKAAEKGINISCGVHVGLLFRKD